MDSGKFDRGYTGAVRRLSRRSALRHLIGASALAGALLFGGVVVSPMVSAVESDIDGDGLFDDDESLMYGTDPFNADTDGDGTQDGVEVAVGTDPRTAALPGARLDTDGDNLTDFDEVNLYGTDPIDYDTDQDGTPDGAEISAGTDPRTAAAAGQGLDTDGDGLSDADEAYVLHTNPEEADSDGDGVNDGEELRLGRNPNTADTPIEVGPSPGALDSDGDGLSDGDEQLVWGTDPFDSDTDGDNYNDGYEASQVGLDPLNPDSDGDGMLDNCDGNPTTPSSVLKDGC